MSDNTRTQGPVLSFGVIADVQYADIEDGQNFSRTRSRYYRNALNLLREAVCYWKARDPPVRFVLQLGDIIDGFNKSRGTGSKTALEAVLGELDTLPAPVYHNWGNHEFYNFSRQHLMNSALFSGNLAGCSAVPNSAYYTIHPCSNLMIISLDCYEVSVLGYEETDPKYQQAMEILTENNTNTDKNDPTGLEGDQMRFVKFNGALSGDQLEWLEKTLLQAQQDRVNVIVTGHVPVLVSSASSWLDVLWNYEEVLTVLGQYKDCVLCYLSGHTHIGGHDTDEHGILHITMPGVIETAPGTNAYSTVDVYNDKLLISGEGEAESFQIHLKFKGHEV